MVFPLFLPHASIYVNMIPCFILSFVTAKAKIKKKKA